MQHRNIPLSAPLILSVLAALLAPAVSAQTQELVLGEDTTEISDHVWAIMGFPNIGIVIGDRATLVVDTGTGPRNGRTVTRAAARLSNHQKLFLTTTHHHYEHVAGEAAFPRARFCCAIPSSKANWKRRAGERSNASARAAQPKENYSAARHSAHRTSCSTAN